MNWGRHFLWVILLAGLAGCQNPMQSAAFKNLEAETGSLAAVIDKDRSADSVVPKNPPIAIPTQDNAIQQVVFQEKEKPKKEPKVILTVPKELPGSDFKKFDVPDIKDKVAFDKYVKKIYPALPPLEKELILAPGPEGRPMTLADLQRFATEHSPVIGAAEQVVVAARGALRQSMAYPNPTVGYEGDTMGTLQAGYQGLSFDQLIKTGNKLQLQGAAATMDLLNAQLALRRARLDVAYQVRSNYFAVLVAQENVKLSKAFARFTDDVYTIQVKKMKGNIAAFYEPMQLRPLALQARFNLIQAVNQYQASWRQLAVSMGLRDMPPSEIAGRVDMPIPVYDYQDVLQRILSQHTDVLTALNNVHKNEYLLKLARITPVPDVGVHVLVQKDFTTPPFLVAPSVGVSVALPVWDRNQGGIQQAQGLLNQALHNLPVAQNSLTNSLADAFNRYLTAKQQVKIAYAQMIDQVKVFGRVYARHDAEPDAVTFGDIVTAQQTLATYLTAYLSALGLQWTAVVDVANLLQTDDLFKGTSGYDDPDVPCLQEIEGMMRFEEVGVKSQKSEARSQESAVKNQRSEVKGQESEIRSQGLDRRILQSPEETVTAPVPSEPLVGNISPFRLERPLLQPPVDWKINQGAN